MGLLDEQGLKLNKMLDTRQQAKIDKLSDEKHDLAKIFFILMALMFFIISMMLTYVSIT